MLGYVEVGLVKAHRHKTSGSAIAVLREDGADCPTDLGVFDNIRGNIRQLGAELLPEEARHRGTDTEAARKVVAGGLKGKEEKE